MTVTKGKDNIPSWDGNPASWTEYRKAAYLYEETVKWENRYLCGPRLAAELSGAAKAAISNKKRGWLSREDGVEKLMKCLKEAMSEPALPEIANQLRAYFKVLRRRRGESMAAFCVRHREEYARTCKALTRVMKEQRQLGQQGPQAWHSGRRNSQGSMEPIPERAPARSSRTGGSSDRAANTASESDGLTTTETVENPAEEDDPTWEEDETWWWWYANWWQTEAWNAAYSWEPPRNEEDSTAATAEEEDDEEDFIEILPDVIKGWLLLEKSNIDHMERSLIQSEVRNNFSLQSVENALRSHFTDDQIRKRDGGETRHDLFEAEDDGLEDEPPGEADNFVLEDLPEETQAFYQQARADEEAAWMQIQQGRQTLREARAKQHDVRMGRKFFDSRRKPNFRMGERHGLGKGNGKNKGGGPCARCGKAHDTRSCPQKSDTRETESKSYEAEEHSEFVYGQLWCDPGGASSDWVPPSTEEAVKEGYGVLDGGATKTMASIHALECLEEKVMHKQPNSAIVRVDTSDRPLFGFGNSEHNRCVSTCYIKIPTKDQNMSLKVHALDKGKAPVLVSVDTLRRMGAIIDFQHNEAIFTKVNPTKLVPLRQSAAGHQLIPLTTDFMEEGKTLPVTAESLSQLFHKE